MADIDYRCHVTGERVLPLGVGTPDVVAGYRYAWFSCPACDRDEHRRSDAGFDASRPGVHVVFLDKVPERPPLRWSFRKQEVSL